MIAMTRACLILLLAAALGACSEEGRPVVDRVPGGDAARGKVAAMNFGCSVCHKIPDIRGPGGVVGPPLLQFGQRSYIAGGIPNRPDNLVRWIMDAPAMKQGTAMPNMHIPEASAKDIAAFLYTLRP